METIQNTLQKFGFELSTAEIYVILANNGEMTVPQIAQKTAFSRASIYDSLSQLLAGGYLEYRKEGRNAFYKLIHPNKLFGLVEEKKRETEVLGEEMGSAIRALIGSFNLSSHKPGVRFFEGEEGAKEALFDSLSTKDIIYTFINNQTVKQLGKAMDEEYVTLRIKNKIKKRIIMIDNFEGRERAKSLQNEFTEIKFINETDYPFEGASEIYDDTVSHIMAQDKQITSMLIKHPQVARMQKMLFEFVWNNLPQAANDSSSTAAGNSKP